MVLSFKHEKHQNWSNTAILDRTLKNARWEGADGEELISKTGFPFRRRHADFTVFQEPVKDKPPAAVAAEYVSAIYLWLGIYQQIMVVHSVFP